MSAQCIQCSKEQEVVEFDTMKQLQEHIAGGHVLPEKELVVENVVVEPPKEAPLVPIVLTYHFVGQCPICRREVDTVDLEVEGKLFMMAYCAPCKKRHDFIPVIAIDKQHIQKDEDSS